MVNLKKLEISETQKKIVLAAIAVVFFVYLDLAFILNGQFKVLKEGSQKSRQLKSTLRQFEEDSANLLKIESDLRTLEDNRGRLEKQVSSELDVANLLDGISQTAGSYDVKIMQIKPATAEAAKEKEKAGNSEFYGFPISMELRSSYHKLGEFLSSLEANPFIGITSLKINYDNDSPVYRRIVVNLKVYVKKK